MIKRNSLLSFTFLLVSVVTNAQNYFEGKIVYEHKFKAKVSNINLQVLKNYLGNGSTLLFKQGNYYHKYNGGQYEFDLYIRTDNKAYLKKRNNDTIFWSDCTRPGDEILDFKFIPKKEKILGITCNQLVIKYKGRSEVHYYNSDSVLTNPEWFKDFERNGQNRIDEKEKSIFLKNESEFEKFIMISSAIKISREPIDEKIFTIPASAILVEMK